MEEHLKLIFTIQANSEAARTAFTLEHNRDRRPDTDEELEARPTKDWMSRETTPCESEEAKHDKSGLPKLRLQFTFDRPPKNLQRGFVFGSDRRACDVLLAGPNDQRLPHISGSHFRIDFDQEGYLMIEDTSTRGTAVGFDGQNEEQHRTKFTWLLFRPFDTVTVALRSRWGIEHDNDMILELNMAVHAVFPYRSRELQDCVDCFLRARQGGLPQLDGLDIYSQASTATPSQLPTPRQVSIYHFDQKLGRGSFGTVNLATNVSTGQVYAAKRFKPKCNFENEVHIIQSVSHENIVKFIDFINHPKPILIMEYVPGGNLASQNRRQRLTDKELAHLLVQALEALEYLHQRKITHRDIKPENILVEERDPNFNIKLADFGLAKNDSPLVTRCGTSLYAAPEIWDRRGYTSAVDIWSLAVVVLTLTIQLPPWHHYVAWAVTVNRVAKQQVKSFPENQRFHLLQKMLELDYWNRPTTRSCLSDALDLECAYLENLLPGLQKPIAQQTALSSVGCVQPLGTILDGYDQESLISIENSNNELSTIVICGPGENDSVVNTVVSRITAEHESLPSSKGSKSDTRYHDNSVAETDGPDEVPSSNKHQMALFLDLEDLLTTSKDRAHRLELLQQIPTEGSSTILGKSLGELSYVDVPQLHNHLSLKRLRSAAPSPGSFSSTNRRPKRPYV